MTRRNACGNNVTFGSVITGTSLGEFMFSRVQFRTAAGGRKGKKAKTFCA
jgi:hypothetical protein